MTLRRCFHLARRLAPVLLSSWITIAPAPASAQAGTAPPPPEDCALSWQITPQLATSPRRLQVLMRFDAGGRDQTTLQLPGGWAGVAQDDSATTRLQAVAGAPTLRRVAHAAQGRVELRWQLTPPADGSQDSSVQLTPRWFALAGQGVLPVPDSLDERHPPTACISLGGLPADSRWASSHGLAEGSTALLRVGPGAETLRLRVQQSLIAGGALQWQSSQADGQPLHVVMPDEPAWRFGVAALSQAGTQALVAQRRFWNDSAPAPALLMLMLPAAQGAGSAAWYRALALQAPPDLPVPGARLEGLLTRALVRSWVAERFGPLAHEGRGDEAISAWFSEGWTDYYTHRQLLRDGRWTVQDYATALNQKLQLDADAAAPAAGPTPGAPRLPVPPGRGEWLALQWHQALRDAAQPGLDAVMRRLLVAPGQARHEGPISAPLATHRLVAALRQTLDDVPLRDYTRHIEQGLAFNLGHDALGPCFSGQRQPVPTWRLGFDAGSLVTRVVSGVEPGGPAEAAGLRDGMKLLGHSMVAADATQPVRLVVQAADGSTQELNYLPAGEPVRNLLRFAALPQAMDKPACQGWLGLGPEALVAAGSHAATKAGARSGGKATARGKKGKKTGTAGAKGKSTKAGKAGAAKSGASKAKSGKAATGATAHRKAGRR